MAIPVISITGKVVDPAGVGVTGKITAMLSRPGSVLDGTTSQDVARQVTTTISAGGTLSGFVLTPNDAITPSGTYYTVQFDAMLADGSRHIWRELWQLASSPSPIDIGAVPRLGVVPGQAVGSDVSAATVLATGSTTKRTASARAADVANVVDWGVPIDGVMDGLAALQGMLAILGTSPRTIVVPGPVYVSASIFIPAIQPVRFEPGGYFTGPGQVTFTPVAGTLTVRRDAGTLTADFSQPTGPLLPPNVNATTPTQSFDAAHGATKLTYASATSGQYTGSYLVGPWDLSASARFAVDIGFDVSATQTWIEVFFISDSAPTYSNYGHIILQAGIAHMPRTAIGFLKTDLSIVGAPNWAAIQRIEVRFYRNAFSGSDTAYLYGVWSGLSARPRILLTFDDARDTLYSMIFPRMKTAGFRGTVYTNGSFIGAATYSTLAQLKEIQAAGWDIANHTWDHRQLASQIISYTRSSTTATVVFSGNHGLTNGGSITVAGCDEAEYNGVKNPITVVNPTTITFATAGTTADTNARGFPYISGYVDINIVKWELRRNRDWLRENGFTRAIDHFAYPYGAWDPDVFAALQALGGKTARIVGAIGGSNWLTTFNGLGSPGQVASILEDQQTAATILAQVDAAIAKQGSLIIFGHGLADSNPTSAQMLTSEFQALLDGLVTRRNAGQCDVVTVTEWYDRLP